MTVHFCKTKFAMISLISFMNASSYAAPARSLEISGSVTSYQVGRLTTKSSGKKNATDGTRFYHLGLQYHMPVASQFLFSPMLRYMPESISSIKSPEGGSRSSLLIIGLPILYNINPSFDVGGGLALMRYTVRGLGGTVTLNNGSGQTEFAQPGRSVTSTTWAVQLGGAYNYERMRVGLDLFTQNLLSTENKRSYSIMLSAGYNIVIM